MQKPSPQAWIISGLLVAPLLLGCGSGSSNNEPEPRPDLGLDGFWQGIGQIELEFTRDTGTAPESTIEVVTRTTFIDQSIITQDPFNAVSSPYQGDLTENPLGYYEINFFLPPPPEPDNGSTNGPTNGSDEPPPNGAEAVATDDATDMQEVVDDPEVRLPGAMLTDIGKNYALVVLADSASVSVLERETTLPEPRQISLLELRGEWEGWSFSPLFDTDEPYRFPISVVCATDSAGVCVVTARGAARTADGSYVIGEDATGNFVWDVTGQQMTIVVTPRERSVFDYTFTDTLGFNGRGLLLLSPDQQFIGMTRCTSEDLAIETPPANCGLKYLTRK